MRTLGHSQIVHFKSFREAIIDKCKHIAGVVLAPLVQPQQIFLEPAGHLATPV